jgi:hypothetical protein
MSAKSNLEDISRQAERASEILQEIKEVPEELREMYNKAQYYLSQLEHSAFNLSAQQKE